MDSDVMDVDMEDSTSYQAAAEETSLSGKSIPPDPPPPPPQPTLATPLAAIATNPLPSLQPHAEQSPPVPSATVPSATALPVTVPPATVPPATVSSATVPSANVPSAVISSANAASPALPSPPIPSPPAAMSRSPGMVSPGLYSPIIHSGMVSPSVHSGVKRLSSEDRQRLANMLRALQIQQQAQMSQHGQAEAQAEARAEAQASASVGSAEASGSRSAEDGAARPAEAGAERGADMAVDAPVCAQGGTGERDRRWRDLTTVNGETAGSGADSPPLPSSPPPGGAMSRKDILEIVRKHSGSLVRPATSLDATGTEAQQTALMMDRRYWQEMTDLFFVRGVEIRGDASQDGSFRDMVFFVRSESPAATPRQLDGSVSGMEGVEGRGDGMEAMERHRPYFARRRQSSLGAILGNSGESIDWRRSFYLNLICHTDYSVTVAVCSRKALENQKRSGRAVPPIMKVTRRAYASPSRALIDTGLTLPPSTTSQDAEVTEAYPNICFAIDSSDHAFESVVLKSSDHCFCVLLNAHRGAAFPAQDTVEKTLADGQRRVLHRGTSSEARVLGEASGDGPKITLFSGFVSYPMVKTSFQGLFSMWGAASPSPLKPAGLVLRGPGGKGAANLAVCPLPLPPLPPKPPLSPRPPLAPRPPLSPRHPPSRSHPSRSPHPSHSQPSSRFQLPPSQQPLSPSARSQLSPSSLSSPTQPNPSSPQPSPPRASHLSPTSPPQPSPTSPLHINRPAQSRTSAHSPLSAQPVKPSRPVHRRMPSLQELQSKLWAVQAELMDLLELEAEAAAKTVAAAAAAAAVAAGATAASSQAAADAGAAVGTAAAGAGGDSSGSGDDAPSSVVASTAAPPLASAVAEAAPAGAGCADGEGEEIMQVEGGGDSPAQDSGNRDSAACADARPAVGAACDDSIKTEEREADSAAAAVQASFRSPAPSPVPSPPLPSPAPPRTSPSPPRASQSPPTPSPPSPSPTTPLPPTRTFQTHPSTALPQTKPAKEEARRLRLLELQGELRLVQEQLQMLQSQSKGKRPHPPDQHHRQRPPSSRSMHASRGKMRSSGGGGGGNGRGSGSSGGDGGGAGGEGDEEEDEDRAGFPRVLKRVVVAPPRRAMVHQDEDSPTARQAQGQAPSVGFPGGSPEGSPGARRAGGTSGATGATGASAGGSSRPGSSRTGGSSSRSPAPAAGSASSIAASLLQGGMGRAAGGGGGVVREEPLRCCLASLSLPWESLAFDLLFKEMPVKVDIGGRIFPPPRNPPSAEDF
ncbi:hypothetical protein CLOM_g1425 [Closterium sp. NIES-68]|nr:hypothetical protein CLOM_g1425 [Closterium sp. NIES-68]GJP68930.1 hypothetical protein CLOP_g25569 [Closterium sp. NIES-67]